MEKKRNSNLILRNIVLNLLGGKCNKCGTTERLEVHHEDGDYKNNTKDNLILFCKKCHMEGHGIKLKEFYEKNNLPKEEIDSNHSKQCEVCGKVITSLSEKQCDWNFKIHTQSHPFSNEIKENDKNEPK